MINDLLTFLGDSPVNFLAVAAVEERLQSAGFRRLNAADPMPQLQAGDCIYFTKNDSSIYAFRIGQQPIAETGLRLICAHTDSPCFRIKPDAEMLKDGVLRLNTEIYGGPILSTWFDRPLSLAGRVMLRTSNPLQPLTRLLHIRRPLLVIPSLAIHFNRQVNDGVKINAQVDTLPVMAFLNDKVNEKGQLLKLIAQELNVAEDEIIDFDLYLYDTTKATLCGLNNEMIVSGRLDDLFMCHAGITSLLAADKHPQATQAVALFDNEETGSGTKQGAASPFLASLVERLVLAQGGSRDGYHCAIERSFMVSADNAHALHPAHAEKYDPQCRCYMGKGPVIKYNARQKYASDADSAAVFAEICRRAGVPVQRFVNHSEVAGGSTLGNILTASLPLRGVDMGAAVWAMHSCCETASAQDHLWTIQAFTEFLNS